MARPANTAAQHYLHGTQSQAAEPTQSVIPPGRPRYPKGLSPAAKQLFKSLCRQLEARRALTDADGELIGLYAELSDRRRRELTIAEDEGFVVTATVLDNHGMQSTRQKKNMHLLIAQESERVMLGILRDLGLTVVGRDKSKPLKAPQPEVVPGSLADLRRRGEL